MMEKHIKIKAFSELTGVSVRTLQYYDEINLLRPAYTNEFGHRFYDSNSFSKTFVILSLKNMGMSLNNINQYINNNDFDIQLFIREEKRRIEEEITDLQLRLMRLSSLEEQVNEQQDITPYILPLFSQITSENNISKLRIESLIQNKDENFNFDIKGWNEFINGLNFCLENGLSSKDKKTIKCIKYWKENILKENKVSNEMVQLSEEYYQGNSANTFGMTEENYKYLVQVMNEYDKNQ